MASTPTRLMTFEEFQQLPEPRSGHHELHHGELVEMGEQDLTHSRIEWVLRRLLEAALSASDAVKEELPFRPRPDHECWRADIAILSRERLFGPERYIQGAPDVVIEILSPSNTAAEMIEKEQICLENGAHEFWIADPIRQQVRVSRSDGHSAYYKSGNAIPLGSGATIAVDQIFQ